VITHAEEIRPRVPVEIEKSLADDDCPATVADELHVDNVVRLGGEPARHRADLGREVGPREDRQTLHGTTAVEGPVERYRIRIAFAPKFGSDISHPTRHLTRQLKPVRDDAQGELAEGTRVVP